MNYTAATFCYIIELVYKKWTEDVQLKNSFDSLIAYYEVVEEMKMPKISAEVELYMANHFESDYNDYMKSRNTAVNIINRKHGK